MKCLVTGATGHIGNVLVKELFHEGYQVTSLVLPNDDISMIEPYTNILYGNILDIDFLINNVVDFDIVFHLAGIVEIGTGKKKKIYKVNVGGTENIIKACQINHVQRLVYTSSVHAIIEKPKGEVMEEPEIFDPKQVRGHYAKSKVMATSLVLNQTDPQLETVVVFPSGVIGPYDYQLSNTGQLFIDYLMGRLTAYINGSYNFVDVRDLAKGIVQAAIKGRNKQSYILSGNNINVKQLLDYIAEYSGRKKIRTKLSYWFILSMSYFAEFYYLIRRQKPLFTHYSVKVLNSNHLFSNDKAKRELGFETRDLSESIQDTLQFATEHYLVKVKNKWKKRAMNQ